MEQVDVHGRAITLIHFTFQPDGRGEWRIACMPNMTEFHQTPYHPAFHRSNDPRAVTCKQCHKTDAYMSAMVANGELAKVPTRGTPRETEAAGRK